MLCILKDRRLQNGFGISRNRFEKRLQVSQIQDWRGTHLVLGAGFGDVDFIKSPFHFSEMSVAADVDRERLIISRLRFVRQRTARLMNDPIATTKSRLRR
jgi:hypothetical protein